MDFLFFFFISKLFIERETLPSVDLHNFMYEVTLHSTHACVSHKKADTDTDAAQGLYLKRSGQTNPNM